MRKYDHYIGGNWEEPRNGHYFDVRNPYTAEVWARVACGDEGDVDFAVAAARAAFDGPWRKIAPGARGDLLRRMADLLAGRVDEFTRTQVCENGKPIAETRPQTANAPAWLHYYAGLADKISGQVIPFDRADHFVFTKYEPLGVVAAIVPWNSPLRLLLWKLAPALAAGNTLVIKPSEVSPVSALLLAELATEAGIPPGVVNVVTGYGPDVAAPLARHPEIDKIAFTGGGRNGRLVSVAAAERFCPVTLELGGKSPNIIFEDCDLTQAVNGAAAAIFGSTGQTCLAGSRLLVHRDIAESVVEGLTAVAASVRHGDPMDPATEYGPVPTRAQFDSICGYINLARQEGATIKYGGRMISDSRCAQGLFIEPTILTNVTREMRVCREEIFGPVVCIQEFSSEQEAIEIANDTPFGLAAGVWTENINRALRVTDSLRAGVVWVNGYRITSPTMPFGGYKESGLGREGGAEMIKEYLQIKAICINATGKVASPFRPYSG